MTENPRQKESRLKRDLEIVKMYPEKTEETIAKEKGLSKGRISQILKKYRMYNINKPLL